uniref:epoxide hydrolase 4-like n=1 Tax=Erigeron canadensis TaxID=72917 RepID=UPI001CB9CF0D|nr:epoxide hydrolase 4-like [Erigeron canadensis]
MVNFFAIQQQLSIYLLKLAGVQTQKVEIEPGTYMNFLVPNETIQKPNKKTKQTTTNPVKQNKPIVVLIHGFAANGIATWQFQIGGLVKEYSIYIPDLLFFGGSFSDSSDRSPRFQAQCLVTALRKLGVERCVVVGFSYGGIVAFKMAELYPEMVRAMVISGSIIAMTDSFTQATMKELGFSSLSEFLLPSSVKDLKTTFRVVTHKKFRFPSFLYKDYLQMMFDNRKERAELLEGLIVSNNEDIPHFPQKIHLLWGENDRIMKMELAQNLKRQLGENTTVEGISKGGHLVHLERPCVYTRCIKRFLASLPVEDEPAK